MIAVITGDIVNSRALSPQWVSVLKQALTNLPQKKAIWEIFRGDSFQVELPVAEALFNVIYIKACIKTIKGADVRMSIGIGKKAVAATKKVTESNGEAYINSGQAFDRLSAEKINFLVKTPSVEFDKNINLYLKLAAIAMDNWTTTSARTIKHMLENADQKQGEIAKITGRSQSSISESLKRAHFVEIMELEAKFREETTQIFK